MSGKTVFDEIASLFAAYGGETYGEGVTTAEHSLQTAALARAEGADEALCLAALLHDVGHFLEERDDRFGYHRHDRSGGEWLARPVSPRPSAIRCGSTSPPSDTSARPNPVISTYSPRPLGIRSASKAAR